MKQRTTLSIETRKVVVVRPAGEMFDFWCEACGAMSAMTTPEHAAEILKIKPRAVYRQVERGELHFVETESGELLICSSSLRRAVAESPASVTEP
jgi:Helix-turn-helix domain